MEKRPYYQPAQVNEPVKFRPLQSKRFCCQNCLDFVTEHTPVINSNMLSTYVATNGIPQVKLECPRGCSRSPHWAFYDITDPRTRKRY